MKQVFKEEKNLSKKLKSLKEVLVDALNEKSYRFGNVGYIAPNTFKFTLFFSDLNKKEKLSFLDMIIDKELRIELICIGGLREKFDEVYWEIEKGGVAFEGYNLLHDYLDEKQKEKIYMLINSPNEYEFKTALYAIKEDSKYEYIPMLLNYKDRGDVKKVINKLFFNMKEKKALAYTMLLENDDFLYKKLNNKEKFDLIKKSFYENRDLFKKLFFDLPKKQKLEFLKYTRDFNLLVNIIKLSFINKSNGKNKGNN